MGKSSFIDFITGKNGLSKIGMTNIIGSSTTAFFWFYIATAITPEEYGQIHYLIGIAGMAQILSLVANTNVLTVYAAKRINIHSTLFFSSIILGSISFVIIFLLFNRIDVSFLVLGYIIFELSNGVLLGRKLFSNYAKIFLLQKFLTLTLGIILYYTFGVEGIIFGLVLSYAPYSWIIIKEFRYNKINFSLIKSRKGFLINNYGINASSATGGQIDKLIIAPLLGFELLGNYALAMQVIVILLMLPNIIFKYLLAQDSSGENTHRLRIYTIVLSICLTILGIILAPTIIPIFFPNFIQVIEAIQIISFIVIPRTISLLYESRFLAMEKSRHIIIAKISTLCIIITGFITLGPIYGIIGLSICVVLASCFSASYLFIAGKKILK